MKTETQTTPKAQHTADEWHTEECANGDLVVVLGERGQRVQIIDKKKAKLIVAAPELLEALEDALLKLKFASFGNQEVPIEEVYSMYPKQASAIKKAAE